MKNQRTEIECNGMTIALEADLGPFAAELTCEDASIPGVFAVRLRATAPEAAMLPDLTLLWKVPSVDLHYKWNSRCFFNRGLDAGTGTENVVDSRANSGMPVYCLYNLEGINACTWALSDAVHDTRTGGSYRHGKTYDSMAQIIGASVGVVSSYAVTLRFDFRRAPYYAALRDVSQWWAGMSEYAPCAVPEAARMPLLSSWYSYMLNIDPDDLEKQCAKARELGMETVILDDGWQTDQTEFGYQNNGDWEVCEAKLPDFADHVKRVQALGMKYMVWFSVPYVGVESKAYQRFKDMLLPARKDANVFRLDPRFPETRAYLVEIYEAFVRRYGIDGLKMDFIGTFGLPRGIQDVSRDGHDCPSLGEGVCKLLDDVMARLKSINPDLLVEFRQHYVGPAMRKYGNMFRAVDCPNSIGDNRVRTLDARLLCGETAVHSDPITWHDDEPAESAAMQIIHALFSVPQISRKVAELTEPHEWMLRQQLAFCREHRDVLLDGELRPLHPHQLYPLVVAKNESKLLAAFYADMPLRLDEELPEQLILVNGTYEPELLVDLNAPLGPVRMTVTSCTGERLAEDELHMEAGLNRLRVPAAASAVVQALRGAFITER